VFEAPGILPHDTHFIDDDDTITDAYVEECLEMGFSKVTPSKNPSKESDFTSSTKSSNATTTRIEAFQNAQNIKLL
jgi:hypothetical protein